MNTFAPFIVIVSYLVTSRVMSSFIKRYGISRSVSQYRIKYINRTLNICLTAFFIILFIFSLGLKYHQVSIFLSSLFAILGVGLFAQWSILSNITGSMIIFFAFPYRVGDAIRVIDKDDDISGVIEEISLFHVIIKKDDDLITYPNSLILQKAVVIKAPSKKASAKQTIEH